MKMILRESNPDPTRAKFLQREIDVLLRMDHPNVIKLYNVFEIPKKVCLVLEYADHGHLGDIIAQQGALSEKVARTYFRQIIEAIDYMHSQGAIHRDLKPENILIDSEGKLKVADFGLSIMMEGSGLLRSKCGTPNYVAPEVLMNDQYEGPPVDVWAAGVILFEMLTSRLPFMADTIGNLAALIVRARVRYPMFLSPYARDLLSHIIVADPELRYTTAEIRAHPWFRAE
jgi:5'-AMP-activated protein kinase catalytic alpha subunit